jgi:hypothetical protein
MSDQQTSDCIARLVAGTRVRLPEPAPAGWDKYPRAPGRFVDELHACAEKDGWESATVKHGGFVVRYQAN